MGQSITRQLPSGSVNGAPILVAAIGNPGTTIHTSQANNTVSQMDEVVLYAYNNDNVNHVLTLQIGGNSANQLMSYNIPGNSAGKVPLGRFALNNGLALAAYADLANKISIDAEVYNVVTI